MTMLTVNVDEHRVMKHMHRLGDEKRSIVILRPADYDEWLHTTNGEAAARCCSRIRPRRWSRSQRPSAQDNDRKSSNKVPIAGRKALSLRAEKSIIVLEAHLSQPSQ